MIDALSLDRIQAIGARRQGKEVITVEVKEAFWLGPKTRCGSAHRLCTKTWKGTHSRVRIDRLMLCLGLGLRRCAGLAE